MKSVIECFNPVIRPGEEFELFSDSLLHLQFVGTVLPSKISIVRRIVLSPSQATRAVTTAAPMSSAGRLMTMNPLYPCGKPCSRGTHNETVKNLVLFSSITNGIVKESRLRISIPWECFQFFNRIENSISFTP